MFISAIARGRLAACFCVLVLLAIVVALSACQQVGARARVDRDKTDLESPSPVTLQIEDDGKKGLANGIGPAKYTSITEGAIEMMSTGSTQREVWAKRNPDGTLQVQLSSGTDINADGVEYNPLTGAIKIKRFGTSASEPIRAGNEAYDRLVAYWETLTQAQKEARLADLEAIKESVPTLAGMVTEIVKMFAGVP